VIESHGTYNPVSEIPLSPFSGIKSVEVIHDSKKYTVVQITHQSGKDWTLAIANEDASETSKHRVEVGSKFFEWKGVYQLK